TLAHGSSFLVGKPANADGQSFVTSQGRGIVSTVRTAVATMAIASCLAAGTAWAQSNDSETDGSGSEQNLEGGTEPFSSPPEIVVTAQKAGAQSLQQVPLAIQAFDGEDLKE